MNKCIICQKTKPLTDEHIIPEFLGGGLSVTNVCKKCNSDMGGGFEGRLSNNFIYKSFRYNHKINGKSEAPFPLEGSYTDIKSGTRLRVNRDQTLKSHPHCEIHEDDEGRIKVEFKVDVDDEGEIEKIIIRKLARHFKAKGRVLSPEKLSKIVSTVIAEHEFEKEELSNPEIRISGHVDFTDIELLHIKIAYELACFHFGEEYILDPVANELRLSLYSQTLRDDVIIQTPVTPDPFAEYINDESHWVIFYKQYCYVSICGFTSKMLFASKNLSTPPKLRQT